MPQPEDKFISRKSTDKKRVWIILLAAFLLAVLLLFLHFRYPYDLRRDYRNIAAEEYDTILLSMYPLDTYHVEDIAYWRGMNTLKMNYCLPELSDAGRYLHRIETSGKTVTTAYLGIRPEKVNLQELRELIERYPNIHFEIILAAPSAEYWQSLSEKSFQKTLAAYCDLLNRTPEIAGANFYFLGSQEWLVSNPSNYETPLLTTELISRFILASSDILHDYLVNADTSDSFVKELTALTGKLRNDPDEFPDLSDYGIILFGDSILANYEDASSLVTGEKGDLHGPYMDTTSIAGILSVTGAKVYNCSFGGVSAAAGPDMPISLSDIVAAFFSGNLDELPPNSRVYDGIKEYWDNPPGDRKKCFVFNFGVNDYFSGFPTASEDPYDIYSYCGAIRKAVKTIREKFPDSRIILCTPAFIGYMHCGENINASGHILKDYVNSLRELSAELSVDILDNYNEAGINKENFSQYLHADEVHPNQKGLYLLSWHLLSLLQ